MSNNIRTTAMLGSLSIGTWEARKNDKSVARKAESEAGARMGTLSATKHLLAGVPELKAIKDYATAKRVWWSKNSVPWFDNGPRAFNAAACVDLTTQIGDFRREFLELVEVFMPVYPTVRANRQFEMGSLFDNKEFPPANVVRQKFYFNFECTAIPNDADIRVIEGIDAKELAKMEKEVAENTARKIGSSVEHAARRLYEVVKKMHDTMSTKIGEPGSKFNDTKLENIIELVEIMPALNLTNDPELVKLTKMAKVLATKSPDELRGDEVKRAAAAKEAKALAAKLAGLFSGDEADNG